MTTFYFGLCGIHANSRGRSVHLTKAKGTPNSNTKKRSPNHLNTTIYLFMFLNLGIVTPY